MKVIVCDAGPIIHLSEVNALHLLKNIGEIILPYGVLLEILSVTNLIDNFPEWIKVVKLSPSQIKEADTWRKVGDLHKGEAEAFILAKANKADWLLTDDSAARLFASFFGMEVHGSLGIMLWSFAHGYISQKEAEHLLNDLKQSSLWLSARVFQEALKVIKEMKSQIND
jgi:predicted nucleic acid-binding protein